jgi:hypothetical protein
MRTAVRKKPGPVDGPGKCWLVARIKVKSVAGLRPADSRGRLSLHLHYALRLGRTVKSRTWVKMLDICIPLS